MNTKFCMSVKRKSEGVPEVSGKILLSVTKWIFGRPLKQLFILNFILNVHEATSSEHKNCLEFV